MEYPNTGSLMPSTNRNSEKSPDFWGEIKVERALLRTLMDKAEGELVTVKLSAWKKESKAGNRFLSLAVNTFEKDAKKSSSEEKDEWDI
jgi:uncharacterized protein (DUF736 family)